MTTATNWLDALNFPTSAETESTLGLDRLDTRVPPSQYQIGGLQISRLKSLALQYSQYFAGMTRVRLRVATANPFAAGEYGHYIHDDGATNYRIRAQVQIGGVDTLIDVAAAAVSTKGDMLVFNGTKWVKLAAGTDGYVLAADSTATSGVAWSTVGTRLIQTAASVTLTAAQCAGYDHVIVGVTNTSAVRTVTLPQQSALLRVMKFTIKDQSGAAAVNNISVDQTGGGTADGLALPLVAINSNYGNVSVYGIGTGTALFGW